MAEEGRYLSQPPKYTQTTCDIVCERPWSPGAQHTKADSSLPNTDTEGANTTDASLSHQHGTWRISPHSRFWILVDKWWLWELVSWVFATICVVATVVVLALYNGRPLPDWPFGLTINAYVSVLGGFAKAGLLLPTAEALGQLKFTWFTHTGGRAISDFEIFDQASRGPWGALMLIIRTRGRALAALGASVVVLSMALDPFFQQVVIFPSSRVALGNSTITRSRLFTSGQFDALTSTNDGPFYFPDRSVYYFVQSMMYSLNSPSAPQVPLVCPTADCTWDPYETLAVCSSCADISHMLKYGCTEAQEDWRLTFDQGALWRYPKSPSCGYYLNASSSDPVLMTGFGTSPKNNETLIARLLPLDHPMNGIMSRYDSSIMFQDTPNPIFDVVFTSTPGGYKGVHANATPVALECNLRWCVKTLNSTVHNGVLQEAVLDSYSNTSEAQYPWSANWTSGNLYYHQTPRIHSSVDDTSFGLSSNSSAFDVSLCFFESTSSYVTAEDESSDPSWRYAMTGSNATAIVSASTTPWSHPENITEHFERVADTFSRMLRGASNGTDTVEGIAYGPQTQVRIRWAWLALPLALLVFSFIFLLAAIVQSRSSGVEVYKTSALAILLHGINDATFGKHDRLHRSSVRLPRRAARASTDRAPAMLRFKGRKGRWRFSRQL